VKFYLRESDRPFFSQDFPTVFFIGRWFHQYNVHFRLHFAPLSRVDSWAPPERAGCMLSRLSFRGWLRVVGLKRGLLELLEDILGRRFWTLKLDRSQDWSVYERGAQMPRIEFSSGPGACHTHTKT
jgi:hypothetical protein